jgi:hypothetical protein
MLPRISAVTSAEMIRDGGSLAAEFIGANGSTYCLHFGLMSEHCSNGDFVRLGYQMPVIFERLKFRYEDRTEWHSINEVQVSWAHAAAILSQLYDLVRNDVDLKWLRAMQEVSNKEGQLPSDMQRVLTG